MRWVPVGMHLLGRILRGERNQGPRGNRASVGGEGEGGSSCMWACSPR